MYKMYHKNKTKVNDSLFIIIYTRLHIFIIHLSINIFKMKLNEETLNMLTHMHTPIHITSPTPHKYISVYTHAAKGMYI